MEDFLAQDCKYHPETGVPPCLTRMLPLGNLDSFRVAKKLRRGASFLFLEELIIL